jgi:apolipoprotein N-acyltransferase
MQYYDKINLAPGWESIPYLSLFHKAGIRFRNEYKFHKKGDRIRLFDIPGQKRRFTVGAPICFEQNAPWLWNRMARLGAEGFIQVSFESWFGKTYFQKQVAYITRLRAIETRRAVARCSNGGLTFFVDPFGRIYSPAPGPESSTTDSIALSKTITFYTRHQNLFPLFCLMLSIGYFILVFGTGFIRGAPGRNPGAIRG